MAATRLCFSARRHAASNPYVLRFACRPWAPPAFPSQGAAVPAAALAPHSGLRYYWVASPVHSARQGAAAQGLASTALARVVQCSTRRVRWLSQQQDAPSGPPVPPPFTWSGFLAAPIKTTKEQWAANKALFKSYGTFAITVYAGVYVTTLGLIYSLLHFGLVEGPDVNALLNGWSVKKYFTESDIELSPFWTRFLTAWLLTKTTEPLRMIGTAAALPVLVRYTPARVLQLFGINKADSSAAIGRMVTRAAHARTAVRARVNMARERAGAGTPKAGGSSGAGKGEGGSPGPSER